MFVYLLRPTTAEGSLTVVCLLAWGCGCRGAPPRLPWSPTTSTRQLSALRATVADGWGATLQSAGNQLIGLREIDMVPAADPHPTPTPTQSISLALQLAHWLASTNCRSHHCCFQPLPIVRRTRRRSRDLRLVCTGNHPDDENETFVLQRRGGQRSGQRRQFGIKSC